MRQQDWPHGIWKWFGFVSMTMLSGCVHHGGQQVTAHPDDKCGIVIRRVSDPPLERRYGAVLTLSVSPSGEGYQLYDCSHFRVTAEEVGQWVKAQHHAHMLIELDAGGAASPNSRWPQLSWNAIGKLIDDLRRALTGVGAQPQIILYYGDLSGPPPTTNIKPKE